MSTQADAPDTCLMCGLLIEDEATGVALIAAERQRQREIEGFGDELDDTRTAGELAVAASQYAHFAAMVAALPASGFPDDYQKVVPPTWPFEPSMWKVDREAPIRALAKTGALVAAEIDRLLREAGVGGYGA